MHNYFNQTGQPVQNKQTGVLRLAILGIALVSACLIGILVWYGSTLSDKVKAIDNQWQEFNHKAAAASLTLNRIESNFGYGGFIHHFKNYVLRKDPKLVPIIQKKLDDTYTAIEKYQLFEAHDDGRKALSTINQTINKYAVNFAYAQKLVANGLSSNEIDDEVRIDDKPALEAIEHLAQHNAERRLIVAKQTNKQLAETLRHIKLGALLIPLLLLLSFGLIFYIGKLAKANELLQQTSDHMSDVFNAAPEAMLIVNNSGVIEEVNESAMSLFGFSMKEFVGKSVEDLMPEQHRDHHVGLRSNAFNDKKRRELNEALELKALTHDGDEVPVEISLSYTQRRGKPFVIASIRDIRERKLAQDQMRNSRDVMNKAQAISHFGSWEWNTQTNELVWSDEVYRIFGLRPKQIDASYEMFLEYLHPNDKEDVINAINATVVYDKPYDIEHRIIQPDGAVRFIHQRGEAFRNEEGTTTQMIGTIYDITEKKEMDRQMAIADNVFSHSSEAILVSNYENKIIRVNDAFSKITGYSETEALGKNPSELLKSGVHGLDFYTELWESLISDGEWEGEMMDRRKDGRVFPAHHNISAVINDRNEIIQYISIFSDITEEKQASEQLENLAQYDQLTTLPNRTLFNDRLERAMARAKRTDKTLGLMFIDLDRFKSVNDTLGHQAGDALLKKVANRLTEVVRAEDTVARLGGDEFTVILEDLAYAEDAALVADKVLSSLQKKIVIDGNDIFIGGSIGISIYPNDGDMPEDIVKSADMAMYQAKQMGRNRYHFYTTEMEQQAQKRFHMESQLRYAIENNELEVYYQPQINTRTGKLIGAEALVRWNHPEQGIISPGEFLPVAEETGLIGPLGDWVLKRACEQTIAWQNQGFEPFCITVNVAGHQIMQGTIVESALQTLKETGLAPEYLELEITEDFVMDHSEKGIQTLHELKRLGITLAIDDFGTGYSSLSYLKRLPIDRLKIDRSFVMDIPGDNDDMAIVSTIIAIAHNLDLTVIAEGVENEEQIDFLNLHDCHEVQGFYFSKPVPAHEFAELFLASNQQARKHISPSMQTG